MKNVLFIHGLNSNKCSGTGLKVKEVLSSYGIDMQLKTFDVVNPIATKKEIDSLLKSGQFDTVIGHSLGGFYTFVSEGNLNRLLINPCLAPQDDPLKMSDPSDWRIKEFAKLAKEATQLINSRPNNSIFGLFGKNDELFSYLESFRSYYGDCYHLMDCGHKPDKESLKKALKVAIEYFQNMQS